MKTGLMRTCLSAAVVTCVCAAMGEVKITPAGGQAEMTTTVSEKTPAKRTEWHGTLAAPTEGAAADVVAVLTARERPAKPYALKVANAELATKVRELAKQGARVVVNGQLAEDEASIAVARCRPMPQGR